MISRGNLWSATSHEAFTSGPLVADRIVDLVVIGAGFTGLNAAIEAALAGASVVVLEAEQIAHGGSGRNVGLVNAGLWLPPDAVVKQLGQDKGKKLVDALARGPDRVFERIAQFDISCEAHRNGTLNLAHSPSGLKSLEERQVQSSRHGIELTLHGPDETRRLTGSGAFHGALFDPKAGTIQPRSYALGLARAASGVSVSIHEKTPVRGMAHVNGKWVIEALNHKITCKSLIIATNAYHALIEGMAAPEYVPVNYCQFATVPLSPSLLEKILPEKQGCWDTAMVMSSFRLDDAGRLIIGGIGNAEGLGAPIHKSWARRKLAKTYPALADIAFEYSWVGKIAMTNDHLPKILQIGPDAYAAFGYSGRGIAPGTLFGTALGRFSVSGDPTVLPIAPVISHRETAAGLRAAYYETGAVVMHAITPPPI